MNGEIIGFSYPEYGILFRQKVSEHEIFHLKLSLNQNEMLIIPFDGIIMKASLNYDVKNETNVNLSLILDHKQTINAIQG